MRPISSAAVRLMLTMLVGVGGCAAPSPSTPPIAYEYVRDISVQSAVAWFQEHTLKCLGPNQPMADLAEWRCAHEFLDGTVIEARILGDQRGVAEIIGIASGLSAQDSAGYLAETVAGIVVDDSELDALSGWAHERAILGGVRVFGHGVVVRLQPYSTHQAVSVTSVPQPRGSPPRPDALSADALDIGPFGPGP